MPVSANVSGVWKTADSIHTRVSGVWKKLTEAWVNVSGTWKRVHAIPSLHFGERRASDANVSLYAFTGVDIGTAADDRIVLVPVGGSHASASGRTVSSVTVGGISATQLVEASGSTGGTLRSEIWAALVPTGTTATVTVTWSGQMENCAIATYAVTGLNSATPRDTAASPTPSTGGESVTIDAIEDGIMVGCWYYGDDPAVTWTGLSEDYDVAAVPARRHSGASASDMTAEAGCTVSVTTSGGNSCALAVVSMR